MFNIHLPAYDAQLRCNLLDCQLLHQTGDDGNTPPIVKPARQIDSPVRTEAPKLTRSQTRPKTTVAASHSADSVHSVDARTSTQTKTRRSVCAINNVNTYNVRSRSNQLHYGSRGRLILSTTPTCDGRPARRPSH